MISAGIDFGTTNSSVALAGNGEPRLVPVEQSNVTIPTAMYLISSSEVYFGRDAIKRYTENETAGRFMRSIKRILGSTLMNSIGTQVGHNTVKFDKIIEIFVHHMKEKIDAAAGMNVESVVMGRPVHFRDNDPAGDKHAEEELLKIAENAGFKNIAFQYEPIAAAFAHERLLTGEKLAAVIDIGGGTSDFTIIRLSPTRKNYLDRTSDVLANTGVRVGGNDFDKNLSLKSFMPEFGMGTELGGKLGPHDKILPIPTGPFFSLSTWNEINDLYNYKSLNQIKKYLFGARSPEKVARLLEIVEGRLGHKNLNYVEDAKIKLSSENEVKMILDFLSDKPTITSTRNQFNESIKDNAKKIQASIDECIKQAGVKATDINLVILTGGSTEIPYISEITQANFPNAELSASDRLSSVGLGLAYDSMRRFQIPMNVQEIFKTR
jgi:hypothetical chaperone protein